MISILKNRLKTLCCDESGVALAFSVVVFLFLYLFGMGIYAVGDTVQKRIKLQNAVDAAAYSGAVVQADALSRIAVINKAMAWTYVMQTRMQMDYIMHKWLGKVIQEWDQKNTLVRSINMASCHPKVCGINYYAGFPHGMINLEPSGQKTLIQMVKIAHGVGFTAHMAGSVSRNTATSIKDEIDKLSTIKDQFEEIMETTNDITEIAEKCLDFQADINEIYSNFEKIVETVTDYAKNVKNVEDSLSKFADLINKSVENNTSETEKNTNSAESSEESSEANSEENNTKEYNLDVKKVGTDIQNAFDNIKQNISDLTALSLGNNQLPGLIEDAKQTIKAMNKAEIQLRDNMHVNIENAIDYTMKNNYPEKIAIKKKITHAKQYMDQLHSNKDDERHFLDFANEFRDKDDVSRDVFDKGAKSWMILSKANGGIKRQYQNGNGPLYATWNNHSQVWVHPHWSPCTLVYTYNSVSMVYAGEKSIRDSRYVGEDAKPLVLTKKYFHPEGAIVVAASVPLNNPFASWGDVSKGLFSAFTVGGGSQKIVAVSAARAGYHNHSESGWETGEYVNRYKDPDSLPGENYIDKAWNLCEADWDAAFIPLNDTTTISASDFKKLIESVGSRDFVPKKDSNKNTKINYQEAVKHVTH